MLKIRQFLLVTFALMAVGSLGLPLAHAQRACREHFVFKPESKILGDLLSTQDLRIDAAMREHKIDLEGYIQALNKIAARDPVFSRVLNLLASQRVTFAIDRSPQVRQNILRDGFRNIYETDRSAGAMRPEIREFVESQYLGLDKSAYIELPNEIKPKSMYLVSTSPAEAQSLPTHYHEGKGDTWIFKRDQIEKNTKFVVGDSYDRALNSRLLTDPKWGIVVEDFPMKRDSLADFVLPLQWLAMATPYFYHQVKARGVMEIVDQNSARIKRIIDRDVKVMEELKTRYPINWVQPEFTKSFFAQFPELLPFQKQFLFDPFGNYVEGLYYGVLDVSKVQKIIIRDRQPSPEELALFHRHGIEVEIKIEN